MKSWRLIYPIMTMCRLLNVSRCGFYAWLKRKPSRRAQDNVVLENALKEIHEESRETYGALRAQAELKKKGIVAGIDLIRKIRRKLGLRCRQKKKFKATTDSRHNMPVFDNILDRNYITDGPNQKWITDMTYIWTNEGWLYLVALLDVFNREVVGYAMGSKMNRELMITALKMAYRRKRPAEGLIHHSDRGSQYCSSEYKKLLEDYKMIGSMSKKADCYDNAMMESFWGTLKKELVHQRRYNTRFEATSEITEYFEIFYNRIRSHSALGYLSPASYLISFIRLKLAA